MTDHSIVAIIPLYNGARWIEQSILSVLSQTLPPDEFIVVDDGSTDGGTGAAIVEQMAKEHPVITLLRKPNGGQSSARNFGVAHSKSTLIALLDQDDIWYPQHLERLVEPFRLTYSRPLGWVYSNIDEIDESGGMVHHCFLDVVPRITGKPLEAPKRTLAVCLDRDMMILPSASLISREAFEAIGGFDERLCGYEDDDLFLRLFREGYDNVYIDEPLSKWRLYPSSTSYSERMAQSRMIYAMKLFNLFPNNPKQNRYFTRDCIAPRFMRNTMTNLLTALEWRDRKAFQAAVGHLQMLHPYLPTRDRLVLAAGLKLFGGFHRATAAFGVRHVLQPIARRLLSAH